MKQFLLVIIPVRFPAVESWSSFANSTVSIVPNLHDASANPAATSLKRRLDGLRSLGFVRVSPQEYMVIYDRLQDYRFSQLK